MPVVENGDGRVKVGGLIHDRHYPRQFIGLSYQRGDFYRTFSSIDTHCSTRLRQRADHSFLSSGITFPVRDGISFEVKRTSLLSIGIRTFSRYRAIFMNESFSVGLFEVKATSVLAVCLTNMVFEKFVGVAGPIHDPRNVNEPLLFGEKRELRTGAKTLCPKLATKRDIPARPRTCIDVHMQMRRFVWWECSL